MFGTLIEYQKRWWWRDRVLHTKLVDWYLFTSLSRLFSNIKQYTHIGAMKSINGLYHPYIAQYSQIYLENKQLSEVVAQHSINHSAHTFLTLLFTNSRKRRKTQKNHLKKPSSAFSTRYFKCLRLEYKIDNFIHFLCVSYDQKPMTSDCTPLWFQSHVTNYNITILDIRKEKECKIDGFSMPKYRDIIKNESTKYTYTSNILQYRVVCNDIII